MGNPLAPTSLCSRGRGCSFSTQLFLSPLLSLLGAGGRACGFFVVTGVWLGLGFLGVFKGHLPSLSMLSVEEWQCVAGRWAISTQGRASSGGVAALLLGFGKARG